MAYSVEVRSPFLDYRIIEFARNLPESLKFNATNRKIILKSILSEYIPYDVFNQPKSGFSIPLSDWLRNELKQEVLDTLCDPNLDLLDIIDTSYYRKIVDFHMTKQGDYSSEIWKVYVLTLWLNNFHKTQNEIK
jgi:asparagine synthase (glutamine-hydrolysing)